MLWAPCRSRQRVEPPAAAVGRGRPQVRRLSNGRRSNGRLSDGQAMHPKVRTQGVQAQLAARQASVQVHACMYAVQVACGARTGRCARVCMHGLPTALPTRRRAGEAELGVAAGAGAATSVGRSGVVDGAAPCRQQHPWWLCACSHCTPCHLMVVDGVCRLTALRCAGGPLPRSPLQRYARHTAKSNCQTGGVAIAGSNSPRFTGGHSRAGCQVPGRPCSTRGASSC